MNIKVYDIAVKMLMAKHNEDDNNQIMEWVSGLKESGKNGDIFMLANGMCAMNYLGWMYYENGKAEIAENFFKGYRSLQDWAYAEDSNGNTINLTDDDSVALYMALD